MQRYEEKNNIRNNNRMRWLSWWRNFRNKISISSGTRLFQNALRYFILLPVIVGIALLSKNNSLLLPIARAAGSLQFEVTGTNDGYTEIGKTGTNTTDVAWNYKPTNNQYACSVNLTLRKIGSPTDGLYLRLYDDSDTSLTTYGTGSLKATSETVLASSLTTSDGEYEFLFTNCQLLTANSYYVFLLSRTGTYSDTNRYGLSYTTGTPSSTIIRTFVYASGWVLQTNTRLFDLYGYESLVTTEFLPATSTLLQYYASSSFGFIPEDCSAYDGDGVASTTWNKVQCVGQNIFGSIINWLFVPSDYSIGLSLFKDGIEQIGSAFPFNIFYDFAAVVKDQADNYTAGSSQISINLPSPLSGTLTLSSTTISTAVGSSTWTTIREYEENAIWTILGLGILFFVL